MKRMEARQSINQLLFHFSIARIIKERVYLNHAVYLNLSVSMTAYLQYEFTLSNTRY